MSDGKSGNQLFAFITGAAVGAVLGILYAPEEGKSTRDKLSFHLDKLKTKLEESIQDLMNEKEKAINTAKEKGEEVTDDVISKAEKLMDEVNELTKQFKSDS